MSYGKCSLVLLCMSVLWLTCVSSAVSNSSSLNVTSKSNSSTVAVSRFTPLLLSSLMKSNRTKASNHTTITTSHPKVKVSSLIGKVHNISRVGSVNITQVGERLANLTSSVKHNSTHPFKNFGQRLNSSRLLERFSSKHSLMSLASTGVSSNKTSTPKTERDSRANVTLADLKNSTESQNSTKSKNSSKTIEKRTDVSSNKTSTPKTERNSRANVTLADLKNSTESQNSSKSIEKRDLQQKTHSNNETVKGTSLTSIIHSLPDLLSNATANVTTWAKKMMFGFNNITSAQNITKKLSTRSVKLELNSTNLNKTSEKTSEVNPEDVEERRGSDSKSNSSLLNADVVTIKREAVNKTLNVSSSVKHSKDSSKAKNFTHTEVKHKAANLTLNATMDGLNKTSLANVTVGNKSNGSLIKSSVKHHNHTKRSMNGNSFVGRLPNFVMGQSGMNVPPVSYVPAPPAPVSYVPAPVQSSYDMAPPAPVYGPTAAPAYSYSTPAYTYSTPAYSYSTPAYQMNPAAAPVYPAAAAAPVYPAAVPSVPAYRPAPVAPSAPVYGVPPAAPIYPQSESYYTAPPPTNAQYNQPMSYPAQPYGSAVPPRQSATESPWF